VSADDIVLYGLQKIMQLMWFYVNGNCYLTREIDVAVRRAGFSHVQINKFVANQLLYPTPLFRSISLMRPHLAGVATK
jgi:hypothetical protein